MRSKRRSVHAVLIGHSTLPSRFSAVAMARVGARLAGLSLLGLIALVLVACEGAEATPTATPTATTATPLATTTPNPTPTAATGTSIESVQQINFADPDILGPVIDHFAGGEVLPDRVVYTDMTGDGVQEAVVIVESGGTMGDLGAAIFEVRGGRAQVLQFIEAAGRIEVRFAEVNLGILVALEPVFEAGDPGCCPSKLREQVWQWDGSAFALITDQVIDHPDA